MIIFSRNTLREALNGLRVLKLSKQHLPVCRHVLVFGYEALVEFDGTNLDQYLRYEGEGTSTTATRVLVPYEVLATAAKSADAHGDIRITGGEAPIISYPVGGASLDLSFTTISVSEFPEKPVPEGESIALPAGVIGAMNEALGCASTDETRYILNSVYLDAHAVVATDGRQLYRRNSLELPIKTGAIFPVSGVPGILPDEAAQVWFWHRDEHPYAQIAVGQWRWITKLVEGNFPEYQRAIPKIETYGGLVRFSEADVTRLRSVLPKLPGFKDRDSVVVLGIDPHKGVAIRTAPKQPQIKVSLERSEVVCSSPIEVGFNARYLLGALETGLRELRVRDSLSPLILTGASRLQMWMPVGLTGPEKKESAAEPSASPSDPSSESTAQIVSPVSETNVSENQNQNTTTTMVASSNIQPVSETREGGSQPVASAPRVALPETPVSAADAVQAKLGKVRDLLRDLGNEIGGLQSLLRDSARQYKALERDHETLKKNIRALREVPV